MSAHRFFVTGPVSDSGVLPLTTGDVHHLRDVLRLSPEEEVVVVDPDGHASLVRLTLVGDLVEADVLSAVPAPALPRVTLVQGLCKGEKMDLIVRQATELGIERVVPLETSRVVVRLDERKREARLQRWQRIAAEAAKQSGQVRVPQVVPVTRIAELAHVLESVDHVLVCWEETAGAGIGAVLASRGATSEDSVAVVVGPEGGLSAEEVDAITASGAVPVSLGETILRTETAGTVASAIALYELGGLGGTRRG
ncbi:MAG: 16S rRNA (uracil(1498)-N(3))-methyltransferase [Coriobacteriia bacterium]|nr:16S rRNA (uracil(1498)-N(3))-methyltransferase [Coriobacteriia bacterium]MBN2822673.1 16S rRNA (uracil(1498)-N(3))-methyltransferase [Coriobacteriia bacterium]